MDIQDTVTINRMPSGVPDLDLVLGGGIPEYSFNVLAGAPGTGKTTMAHQMVFANATPEHPAIYFTVLGEPSIKMLRYQQQFTFYDAAMVGDSVRFINLSEEASEGNLEAILQRITREVEEANPSIVVVDSFRTMVRTQRYNSPADMGLQEFVQRLALLLTSWEATTFLVGEYAPSELQGNPVFTVADSLVWLYQTLEHNSSVRNLQVVKLRGQASLPGLHTFRIDNNGVHVFPRTYGLDGAVQRSSELKRLSTGVADLDEMMCGGIPEGDSIIITGPSGSGKSVLATQFIHAGLEKGDSGIIAVFEERPGDYITRAEQLGMNLQKYVHQGKLKVIYLRPLDLSVDETLRGVMDAATDTNARRVVIDSVNGFEIALAPAFRREFRESLYRMVGALTGHGITIMTTVETVTSFQEFVLSPYSISFLTDDIIVQRYIEVDGQLHRIMAVLKMRRTDHSKDFREYHITDTGMVIGDKLSNYRGLITGVPDRIS